MKRTTQFLVITFFAIGMVACKNTEFKKTKEGYPYQVYSDGKGEKMKAAIFISLPNTTLSRHWPDNKRFIL